MTTFASAIPLASSPLAASPIPLIGDDGSIDAVVVEKISFGEGALLRLHLPITISASHVSGRYFLVRCGTHSAEEKSSEERTTSWQFPLRKALFASTYRTTTQSDGMPVGEWQFLLPHACDNALSWLHEVKPASILNLLGPFGNGFQLDPLAQRLLILADSERSATMLGLIDEALDAGKKVAVLIQGEALCSALVAQLAIAVEVHQAADAEAWNQQVAELLGWADQLCMVQSQPMLPQIGALIQQKRSRFDQGFAQILVEADLVCGVGACLACIVPLANGGITRACAHGPVLDLRLLL